MHAFSASWCCEFSWGRTTMNSIRDISVVTAIISIIVSMFLLDARYMHVTTWDAKAGEMQAQSKRDYLELRLEIARTRVLYLVNKATLTADEQEELEFTRNEIRKLQDLLVEL